MKTQISIVSAAILAALAVSACRKEEPQNPSQFQGGTQQGWQTQPGVTQQPQPGVAPQPYPAATPAPATGAPPAATGAAPPAAAGGCDAGTAGMLAPVLMPLQQTQAPGSKAIASVCAPMAQTGQVLEVAVTLQPGKCYTGIGGGLPPLTQLDLVLEAAAPIPGMPPMVMAQSAAGGGVQPVLGGKPNCFKNPLPVAGPAKFKLKISGGQGPAIATIYEKLAPF